MSARLGGVLPPEIQAEFDGHQLRAKPTTAHFLITADADGCPRPCMLSAGEILAVGDRLIRLAVWPDSSTAANLRRGGRAVLCYVRPGAVRYIRGLVRRTWDAQLLGAEIGVEDVYADDHPGFTVSDGIRFRYEGSADDLTAAWSAQLAALRDRAP